MGVYLKVGFIGRKESSKGRNLLGKRAEVGGFQMHLGDGQSMWPQEEFGLWGISLETYI